MAVTTAGTVALADIRPLAAAALEPSGAGDPDVLVDIVDSPSPPVLMLEWDDPWLEAGPGMATMGPCTYQSRLRVVCIATRLVPGAGIATLEGLVAYVLGRMRSDPYTWALVSVQAPAQRDWSGVDYLVANVLYAVQTSI